MHFPEFALGTEVALALDTVSKISARFPVRFSTANALDFNATNRVSDAARRTQQSSLSRFVFVAPHAKLIRANFRRTTKL